MPGSQSFKIPYVVFEVKVWWDEVKVDFIGQREESCAKRREVKSGARRPDVVSTRVNLEHHQVSNLCLDQPQFLRPPIPRYFHWRSSSRQNRLWCHKLGNWSQWCWSRQSRNPGRPCTRSLKSWSAVPPCKSLTSAILGHGGGRSARKGDDSKIPGKFIFYLFNCICETHQSPVLFSTLSTPMNQFVHSAERFCWFMFDMIIFHLRLFPWCLTPSWWSRSREPSWACYASPWWQRCCGRQWYVLQLILLVWVEALDLQVDGWISPVDHNLVVDDRLHPPPLR